MDHGKGGRLLASLLRREDEAERLQGLLQASGGWRGAYLAGPEQMIARLGEEWRRPIEALFGLVEDWLSIEPLPAMVDRPEALAAALRPRLSMEAVEAFWVVALDARARIVAFERVSMGTLTACLVHPREVFVPAIRVRAASIVVLHNHPSGDPEPSLEDLALTDRLCEAGRILGIPLLDHIVVARAGIRSLIDSRGATEGVGMVGQTSSVA